jgi:hypothetical protein
MVFKMKMPPRQRSATEAGFAIGPILFVLAILAMIAGVIAAGFGDYGAASVIDRVAADIPSQTNLIRTAVNQCNGQYLTYVKLKQTEDSSYAEDPNPYPHSAAGGTAVDALLCDPLGAQSVWANISYPQVPKGFNTWTYIDASATDGGRCVWTTPQAKNSNMIDGLNKAAHKFTTQPRCDGSGTPCTAEVLYDPASASLKFALWITLPKGTPDSHCLP